jgi:hypothetical protein
MKKLAVLLFLITQAAVAQVNYLLPNEQLVLSFETVKGKKVVFAKDKNNGYLVYRYGTKDKIKLEYPKKDKSSWGKFMYATYLRGGGKANSGMEIENIYFENNGYRYVVYYHYYAGDNEEPESTNVGLAVVNSKTPDKINEIDGKISTMKGNIGSLRNDGLIKDGSEKYGLY